MKSSAGGRVAACLIAAAVLQAGGAATAAPPSGGEGLRERGIFSVRMEGGPVWQSRNDAEIPNDGTATRFSISDLIGSGPSPAARVYLRLNLTGRHSVELLLAPLTVNGSGTPASDLRFAGEEFEGGVEIDAVYRFNSWRAGWNYTFYEGERSEFGIGFTAKLRDAKIQLDQHSRTARKTDLGFVPLLHLEGRVGLGAGWMLLFDADALAGGPGRAEDVSVRFGRDFGRRWRISMGYRMIEGGADVEEVYNFAWLHYAVVSFQYEYGRGR